MHLYGTQAINAQGHLTIGGCDAVDLAREYGTPLYVFDEALIRRNMRAYIDTLARHYGPADVAYAGKAFLCTAMAALAHAEGCALDVSSGGEIYTALAAGVPAARLYYHGNNKAPAELRFALEQGVGRIVVDNLTELALLEAEAARLGKQAVVQLRITPGVEAHTHHYIATGQLDSKFGIVLQQAAAAVSEALRCRHVQLVGLHCHIGSQIFDLQGPRVAAEVMMGLIDQVRRETGFVASELNLGGGLGVRYTAEDTPTRPDAFVQLLGDRVKELADALGLPQPKLIVEPGRSIVGEAGTTLYTVGSIKEIPGIRTYVAIDGGMGDNPRPALYEAKYEAVVANRADQGPDRKVSIAGRTCESGDMLIWDLPLCSVQTGDILAVFTTGAYNYAMSSHYNRYPKPAAVFVADGRADLVVRRETYADLLLCDIQPERLRPPAR